MSDVISKIKDEYNKAIKDNSLNESAGIGLKPLKPFFDDRKAEGIVVEVVNAKSYLDKSIAFMEHVENLSMAAVDKAVKVNADFHSEVGLAPKIKRVSVGKCCEWCQKIVGLYDYEDVKDTGNDVFRRHSNCRCQVQYIPTRGKVKNVHTKR